MLVAALLAPWVAKNSAEKFRGENIFLAYGFPAQSNPDAALIFGGDGTMHRYLPQLRAKKIPCLIVPKGSGNDFAHALGIRNERVALRAWKEFCATRKNVRHIDLGVIRKDNNETLFCCVAGAGLDAEANARANRMPAWLRHSGGYLISAVQALFSFRPAEVRLVTESQGKKLSAILVAVGNAHRYGGGIKIVPRARLDDGMLDVCLVARISKLKVLFCLPLIYFGGHTRLKEVQYFQARQVRIESDPALSVYADGELICQTGIEIGVLPESLTVIVPPE